MKVTETHLPGVLVIEPVVHGDSRGFFKETYQASRYREIGVTKDFVQDNYSRSRRGVLRGLHYQKANPQGKLVTCSFGSVFDVAVDIDPSSTTFGQWFGIELSDSNHLQLWIPPGYAHGFCVLSEYADFAYKCTALYDPNDEYGVIWNDPDLEIQWPVDLPSLSPKDQTYDSLKSMVEGL